MSFVAPTSNIVVIDSGSQSIASGTISITLNVRDAAGFGSNAHTMDVTSIGGLELDFNYIEDIGDINEFVINVPRFEFEMLDSIQDSSSNQNRSFVDLITQLGAEDLIVAKVTFNDSSDYFYTTRDQCEFDFLDRKVKLDLQHPLKFGSIGFGKSWDASVFSGKLVDYYITEPDITDPQAVKLSFALPQDVIKEYLSQISDNVNVQYFSTIYDVDYQTSFGDGDTILMPSASSYSFYDDVASVKDDSVNTFSFSNASTRVKEYALSEAAIVGTALGYGFYVPRFDKNTDLKADLTSADFESLEMDVSFKNVRYFSFDLSHTSDDNVSNTNVLINEFGQNNVNVTYPQVTFQEAAEFLLSDNVFVNQTGSSAPLTDANYSYPAGFESNLLSAYKKVFRISDTTANVDAGVYISGTILGIDKLLPHGYFGVSSGVHPLVNGKDFRPAYLKFDFEKDTIEFEAYEF